MMRIGLAILGAASVLVASSTGYCQNATAPAIVIGRDAANNTFNIYPQSISNSELSALRAEYQERSDEQKKIVKLLEEKLSLREDQIRNALSKMSDKSFPESAIGDQLIKYAADFTFLKQELDRVATKYPQLKQIREDAQSAINDGDFTRASLIIDGMIKSTSHDLNAQSSELIGLKALAASLNLEYRNAASLYLAAAMLAPDADSRLRFQYECARQYYGSSNELGSSQDRSDAINILEDIRKTSDFDTKSIAPDVNILLASFLVSAWQSKKDDLAIDRAESLILDSKNKLHIGSNSWISASNALATVYFIHGRYTESIELYTILLDKYYEKINDRTKLLILTNIAAAVGASDRGESRYDAAIGFLTRAMKLTFPDTDHAYSQARYNLAIAIFQRALLRRDVPEIKNSIELFNRSLRGITQSSYAVSWANVQTNLGIAHLRLYAIEAIEEYLNSAIKELDAALSVWDPTEAQHRWHDCMFLKSDAYKALADAHPTNEAYYRARIDTILEIISRTDHDQQSDKLYEAYDLIIGPNILMYERFRSINNRREAIMYIGRAKHLLAERYMSGLISIDEARTQAIYLEQRTLYLNSLDKKATPQKKPNNKN